MLLLFVWYFTYMMTIHITQWFDWIKYILLSVIGTEIKNNLYFSLCSKKDSIKWFLDSYVIQLNHQEILRWMKHLVDATINDILNWPRLINPCHCPDFQPMQQISSTTLFHSTVSEAIILGNKKGSILHS